MKVILQKDIPSLGDAGEIKEVAAGHARNYLIPRRLVIPASVGSTRALEHQKRLIAIKAEKRKKEMEDVAARMKGVGPLVVKVRVGAKGKLFGSVTSMVVANALGELGFVLDKRKIEIGESIKSLGEFPIKVRLAEEITVPLKISVVADESFVAEEEEDFPDAAPAAEKPAEGEEGAAEGEAEADGGAEATE
jgi:large subunit ribosomal protein L9